MGIVQKQGCSPIPHIQIITIKKPRYKKETAEAARDRSVRRLTPSSIHRIGFLMNQQLIIKKDRELVTLRSQVQSLNDELMRTLRTLKDREHENHRISQQLSDIRDASIQRDLVCTIMKQLLYRYF
jgi:mRNA-degrading endonuclease YafQ of YafQ-DinJ toxin-antitoxin module